jgi:hypothetical protein
LLIGSREPFAVIAGPPLELQHGNKTAVLKEIDKKK